MREAVRGDGPADEAGTAPRADFTAGRGPGAAGFGKYSIGRDRTSTSGRLTRTWMPRLRSSNSDGATSIVAE